MQVIIDTNVLLVANNIAPQASEDCILETSHFLTQIKTNGLIVIDDDWLILSEYKHKLNPSGQKLGVGDEFLLWLLRNYTNPQRCRQIKITPINGSFAEFPDAPSLVNFDRSDHKFVAVAIADPKHPPIYNAVDSDWSLPRVTEALATYGVQIVELCPDSLSKAS